MATLCLGLLELLFLFQTSNLDTYTLCWLGMAWFAVEAIFSSSERSLDKCVQLRWLEERVGLLVAHV